MVDRPTSHWLRLRSAESAEIAEDGLNEEDTYLAETFPDELIDAMQDIETEFEETILATAPTDIDAILKILKTAVLALNMVERDIDDISFEADEREVLSDYFDAVLTEHGIDLAILASRSRGDVLDLTETWRTW